jgi:phosphoglycerate dehydrogenase-like enzyme
MLARALKQRLIARTGLDVAYKEPLPPDDPLWSVGNVIIACHSSGHSPQTEVRRRGRFAENLRRYVNGLPLLNVAGKQGCY